MLGKPWIKGAARSFAETEPITVPMAYGVDFDAPTEPLPLLPTPGPAPQPLALAPQEVRLYDVIAEIRKNNRVCLQPTRWLEFYRMLEAHADGQALPPEPFTGSAWAATPALAKSMCFRHQVEWAATHNLMNTTWLFLQSLPESDWHYG
ncbi:MAG: hypothetical protein JWP22_702 [Ramlibacter sp.]|jgi:hypothetical protein|nr:hypothetical protein [Ramlibacter sp.]MDB5912027.1 hypothetical protein [Ramlibacter sp.]